MEQNKEQVVIIPENEAEQDWRMTVDEFTVAGCAVNND